MKKTSDVERRKTEELNVRFLPSTSQIHTTPQTLSTSVPNINETFTISSMETPIKKTKVAKRKFSSILKPPCPTSETTCPENDSPTILGNSDKNLVSNTYTLPITSTPIPEKTKSPFTDQTVNSATFAYKRHHPHESFTSEKAQALTEYERKKNKISTSPKKRLSSSSTKKRKRKQRKSLLSMLKEIRKSCDSGTITSFISPTSYKENENIVNNFVHSIDEATNQLQSLIKKPTPKKKRSSKSDTSTNESMDTNNKKLSRKRTVKLNNGSSVPTKYKRKQVTSKRRKTEANSDSYADWS
jgi:hypothetical protein